MSRSLILVVMCAGCEWGGGAGIAGLVLPDAPRSSTDSALRDAASRDGAAQLDGGSGSCSQPQATGTLATWSFNGAPGNQASTPATSSAPGATAGDIGRSADLAAAPAANSINSTTWPSAGALDTTKGYYTFTIAPPSGCSTSLTGASIETKVSGTGPSTAVVATSADAFAQTSALTISTSDTTSTPTLSVSAASGTVELRIFGYGAGGPSGTFRVEGTLTLAGSFQ